MATNRRSLRYLVFAALAAVLLFGLVRFAHHKPIARPRPEVSGSFPPQLPQPAPNPGQNRLPPCWVAPVPNSAEAPAPQGRVEDCPLLLPGENNLSLLEVNLATGAFLHVSTDLFVPARPPLAFTRVSRPVDEWTRQFGVFVSLLYDEFPVGNRFPYTYMELVTPDGQQFRYDRFSPGTSYADARYRHEDTGTVLSGSKIGWNGNGWNLTTGDGSILVFPDAYAAKRPQQGAVVEIRDAQGDRLRLLRDKQGNLQRIVSQDGQWREVHEDLDHICAVNNSRGESAQYTYDDLDRLSRVQSPDGVLSYSYDDGDRVATISKSGALLLRNDYDSLGRIVTMTFADGGAYQFDYAPSSSDGSGETTILSPLGRSVEVQIHPKSYAIVPLQ
jgi:YD repeat-containing protein